MFRHLSFFLSGSSQKADTERIWTRYPQVRHLCSEHIDILFPTTLPTQHWALSIPSLTNPYGHFASHMGCPFAKAKSLRRSHTKVQDHEFYFKGMAKFRTFRKKEQKLFFLNFSFGASWLQILQVLKERYVQTVWAQAENLWFTGLWSVYLTPESQDLTLQSHSSTKQSSQTAKQKIRTEKCQGNNHQPVWASSVPQGGT